MSCNCARLLARSLKSPQCGYFSAESATGAQERVSAVLACSFFSGMYEIEYLYLTRRKLSCCSSIGAEKRACDQLMLKYVPRR